MGGKKGAGANGGEFKVKEAPWENPPNTGDASSFPGLGGPAKAANLVWARPTGTR